MQDGELFLVNTAQMQDVNDDCKFRNTDRNDVVDGHCTTNARDAT